MHTNAPTTPSAPSEAPAGQSFGNGLLQAVLDNTIPSAIGHPLTRTGTADTELFSVTAGSSSGSLDEPTPEHVAQVPAAAPPQAVSGVTAPAQPLRRSTRSAAEPINTGDPPAPAARAPVRARRSRAAAPVASPAPAPAPAPVPEPPSVSSHIAMLNSRIDALSDSSQAIADHLADNRTRVDNIAQDTGDQLASLHDSVNALMGLRTEVKQLRTDGNSELRDLFAEIRDGLANTSARLAALEADRSQSPLVGPPAKRPRTGEGQANDEQPMEVLVPPMPVQDVPPPVVTAPSPMIPAVLTTAGLPHTNAVAPVHAPQVVNTPAVAASPIPVVSPAPPVPVLAPPTMETVSSTHQAPMAVAAPVAPVIVPAPPAHAISALPNNTPQAMVVSAPAVQFAQAVNTAFPPMVSTPRGARRNFYVRMGPVNTGGAAPLAVIQALLNLLPNGLFFSRLVKEAQLLPTDFTYIVGTTYSYENASGVVQAWATTRPDNYASVSAELFRGN